VGRARRRGGAGIQLFAHYPRDSSSGGGGGYTPPAELLGALEAAAGGATEVGPGGVGLERASEATPGLPPTASAGSFVRVARGSSGSTGGTVPAVLLSDFDAAFRGSTFQSQHDTADTTDADSIAATAVVLARAAQALALRGGGGGAEPAAEAEQQLPVDYAALKGTVEGLMQVGAACLTACPPARPPACQLQVLSYWQRTLYSRPRPLHSCQHEFHWLLPCVRLPAPAAVPAKHDRGAQLPAGGGGDDPGDTWRQGIPLHRNPAHPHCRQARKTDPGPRAGCWPASCRWQRCGCCWLPAGPLTDPLSPPLLRAAAAGLCRPPDTRCLREERLRALHLQLAGLCPGTRQQQQL
jgi:hypothetical protein